MAKRHKLIGNPRQGLFGATLGFFVGFAAVSLFGPTVGKFDAVMHLSGILKGLLVAAPMLSGSLLRIPFSAWVETTGGRKPFIILLMLSIIGMVALSLITYFFYPSGISMDLYPWLLLFGVLSGCGIATFSVGIGQVSYWYPQKKQGWALGAYAGIGNLAPGIISFVLPLAMTYYGLTRSYVAWTIFLVIGTLAYCLWGINAWYFQLRKQNCSREEAKKIAAEEYGQELFPTGSMKKSLAKSASMWETWALVAIYFTSFGGFLAVTAWFFVFWQTYYQLSLAAAGLLTAIFSLLASAIRIPGGSIADRIGGTKTMLFSLSILLVGALVMSFSHHLSLSIFAEILMAIGMGVTNAGVFKLVPTVNPKVIGGTAGWVGGLGAFGGFVIPPLLGFFVKVIGIEGHTTGFLVFVVLAAISLVITKILQHATKKNQNTTLHPKIASAN